MHRLFQTIYVHIDVLQSWKTNRRIGYTLPVHHIIFEIIMVADHPIGWNNMLGMENFNDLCSRLAKARLASPAPCGPTITFAEANNWICWATVQSSRQIGTILKFSRQRMTSSSLTNRLELAFFVRYKNVLE